MRLERVNTKAVKEVLTYKRTKNQLILEEFANSGEAIMEVKDYRHKTAECCVNVLNGSAKRFSMRNIKAYYRGEHVYLINIDKIK